ITPRPPRPTLFPYTTLFRSLYEGETNTRVLVLLDISGSMNYGSGEVKKIDYARILAACLSYFSYHQRDGVGLLTFDTDIRSHVRSEEHTSELQSRFDLVCRL